MNMRLTLTSIIMSLLLVPQMVLGATLYVDPSAGTYGLGDTFVAEIRLHSEGDCINATQVTLRYPRETLKAVDFSRGDSIMSLWVQEPTISTAAGTVTFAAGVPGGYCGRIQGDPSFSNVVGKVVFTVIGASAKKAALSFGRDSTLYANDGLGTEIKPKLEGALFDIVLEPQLLENPWVKMVQSDTVPPEQFTVQVESTKGVFGGKYYLVFSTLDKQSGLDHYDIFDRGGWSPVTSPHELRSQTLLENLQVRAVDKAGNVRMGLYVATSVPPLQAETDMTVIFILVALLILAVAAKMYLDHRHAKTAEPVA
jgi:hypothetical protein